MNLRNKRETFRQVTGTKKTLNLTMITTYGIKNGKYSNLISGQVVLLPPHTRSSCLNYIVARLQVKDQSEPLQTRFLP